MNCAPAQRASTTRRADAQLPRNFTGVLDPIFVRALVVDNGRTRAALVAVDAGAIPTDLYNKVSARAAGGAGDPCQPAADFGDAHAQRAVPARRRRRGKDPAEPARGVARLQPARVAWGTGVSYINVNRDRVDPVTNRWWEGPNYDGTSDKTVAVVRVETPAGEPIAVYYNYAVHGVLTGTLDMISGDIPGATSRYVEESLGGRRRGAVGERRGRRPEPDLLQPDLRAARDPHRGLRETRRGHQQCDAARRPGPGSQQSARAAAHEAAEADDETMGQMLGEEVLHVMRESLEKSPADATLSGAQASFSCPARRRTDSGRAGFPGTYVDADEVSIRLGALRIGDVYIGTVDGEVYNGIAQRLKRESPFKHTMMSTLTNGSAPTGYIPSDDAFGRNVFTVLSSRLKPGCAEAGIVDGLVELMRGL